MSSDIINLASELRATLGMLKRRLRERGGVGDLTPTQTDVLVRLDRDGPSSTSKLARDSGIRPQSMGTIIAGLEAAGLVNGSPDPNDGRQTLISLTAHCQDMILKGRAARQDWLTSKLEQLSPDEQANLIAAVAILRRISED